jgi:protein-S-isoprenylcysteine O-methyltransferase Ste14
VTQENDPMEGDETAAGAQVRIPPPLVFVAGIAVALVLGWLWPRAPWLSGVPRWLAGLLSLSGGVALIVTAFARFRQTGQDPKPWHPSPVLLTDGPYQITRNPMYLGLCMIMVGLGFLVGNAWFTLAAFASGLAVTKLAVEPEEAYLEQRFGDDYRTYKRRVRRWM